MRVTIQKPLETLKSSFLLAALSFIGISQVSVAQTITLNPNIKYQKWVGLEAQNQSGQDYADFPKWSNTLFDLAVNDLGITRVRLETRSGYENTRDIWNEGTHCSTLTYGNPDGDPLKLVSDPTKRGPCLSSAEERCLRYSTVNDNNDPNVINWSGFQFSMLDHNVQEIILPLKQRVEARGEKFFLNLLYNGFKQYKGNGCAAGLKNIQLNPAEYAEYMLAVSLYLKNTYGLVPDIWEVLLEPENTEFNTASGQPADILGQLVVAAGNKLKSNGFNPRFSFPSVTGVQNFPTYFNPAIAVPGAAQFIDELAYHRYGTNSSANLLAVLSAAQQYGYRTAMLEYLNADSRILHEDLKLVQNSSWQQFTIGFPGTDPTTRGSFYRIELANNNAVLMNNETPFIRQYFKYIRPGAQRIEATTSASAFDPLAFINANGNYAVVIRAGAAGNISINGLPAGTYGLTYTTSPTATLISKPDLTIAAGGTLSTSMPAAGTISIFTKSAVGSTPTPSSTPSPTATATATPTATPDILAPKAPSNLAVGG